MKTSVKLSWIVAILASTLIFSLVASGSDDWHSTQILVQEAVYEYVPASQTQVIICWVGAAAFSLLAGLGIGLLIYGAMEEKKHE